MRACPPGRDAVTHLDWLYPVRELAAMGIGHLASLAVKIDFDQYGGDVKEVEAWVRARMATMEADAEKGDVDFLTELSSSGVRSWLLRRQSQESTGYHSTWRWKLATGEGEGNDRQHVD